MLSTILSTSAVVYETYRFTKFSYDLWGNTVNTASRMESSSQHGRAQVSPSTYAALKDSFVMEAAGTVDCKGIGEVVTHFLVARAQRGHRAWRSSAAGSCGVQCAPRGVCHSSCRAGKVGLG